MGAVIKKEAEFLKTKETLHLSGSRQDNLGQAMSGFQQVLWEKTYFNVVGCGSHDPILKGLEKRATRSIFVSRTEYSFLMPSNST